MLYLHDYVSKEMANTPSVVALSEKLLIYNNKYMSKDGVIKQYTNVMEHIPFGVRNTTTQSINIYWVCYKRALNILYSFDLFTWLTITAGSSTTITNSLNIIIPPNGCVYFKSVLSNSTFSGGTYNYISLACYYPIEVFGNIKSLFRTDFESWDSTPGSYCFFKLFSSSNLIVNAESLILGSKVSLYCYKSMFSGCYKLTKTPLLPATVLATSCYEQMFYGCNKLEYSPELPATALANSCYKSMFYNCSSLTTASLLPATTLATSCYEEMFYNCKLLQAPELPATTLTASCYANMFYYNPIVEAPLLPATTLANNCYEYMFNGCTKLEYGPELPATELAPSCYRGMFYRCFSLIEAPALPATNLSSECYYNMFGYCGKLVTAPELPATTLLSGCYSYMFLECYNLVNAPALPATTLADSCYANMFYNCSSLTTAPDLPATTLVSKCYQLMFYWCWKLNYIKALFTTTPGSSYTQYWLSGTSNTGTFVKNASATWDVRESSGIPYGWTIETADS